ncbi:MAG: helix-turn-helix transcriptional regulator [Symploca sp. SIO2E6]|nr:helix-turn-helix transcriptional regulator [Symploca sp. SIO2E6]
MEVFKQIRIQVPELGQKIKKAREQDPRSVQLLATLAKISISYWYQIEQEKRDSISEETLRSIEKVLGVDFGVNLPD